MHIWPHTHKHVDTQRVPGQVTFTFALATRQHVIHSMRIHHVHHFMCVLYIRYSTPEHINLAFHTYIHLQCSSHIQGSTLFQSRDAL
ncbi:hypothetical protein V8B55DRAFT_1509832 [Mucor lusitanicus]